MSKENELTEETVPIPTPVENALIEEPIPAAAPPETPVSSAPKAKRNSRVKKAASESTVSETDAVGGAVEESAGKGAEAPVMLDPEANELTADDYSLRAPSVAYPLTAAIPNVSILTLDVRGEVETKSDRDEIIWHELHNAYRTRKILTGQLGGVEQMENNKTIVIVDYKGFRVVIPLKEMMIQVNTNVSGKAYGDLMIRMNKLLGKMLGAEIDFIVRGIDAKTRAVVASRKEAMLKKRQTFYMDLDANGIHRIYEGRLVQARVIAVAEKVSVWRFSVWSALFRQRICRGSGLVMHGSITP